MLDKKSRTPKIWDKGFVIIIVDKRHNLMLQCLCFSRIIVSTHTRIFHLCVFIPFMLPSSLVWLISPQESSPINNFIIEHTFVIIFHYIINEPICTWFSRHPWCFYGQIVCALKLHVKDSSLTYWCPDDMQLKLLVWRYVAGREFWRFKEDKRPEKGISKN